MQKCPFLVPRNQLLDGGDARYPAAVSILHSKFKGHTVVVEVDHSARPPSTSKPRAGTWSILELCSCISEVGIEVRTHDPGNTPFQGLSQGSREVRGEMEKKELPSQSPLWPSAHSFPCQALLNGEGTDPLPDPAPHPMPHGLSIPQPHALTLEPDPRVAATDRSKEDSTPTPVTALLISNKITQRAVLLPWGQARESVMNYPGLGLTGLQPRALATI